MTATRHPLRHPIQIIVCMSHLYGDTLYYATSLFDHYANGKSYCRPEPYYFWVYYFLMNFIWIVVPFCMDCSHSRCNRSTDRLDQTIYMTASLRSQPPFSASKRQIRNANPSSTSFVIEWGARWGCSDSVRIEIARNSGQEGIVLAV